MSLQQQLTDDLKTAMKAREATRVGAIRLAIAGMKNKAVELGRGPQGELSDDEVMKLLASELKKRKDASSAFRDNDRPELADKEDAEAAVYLGYMPEQLDEAGLIAIVDEVVAESGASSMKDMGPTIKAVMAKVGGQADGGRVSALVKGRLA
jgi:uncharacterized protein YqeY